MSVSRNLSISGGWNEEQFFNLCDLHVGGDFSFTDTALNFGAGIGDNCASNGRPAVTVDGNMVVKGNNATDSALEVGGDPGGI